MVATAGPGWRLAPCLVALFDQADARWPNRRTVSDGSIGDAAHRNRKSFHNPDASGDVLAADLTHDPVGGPDGHAWAEHLRTTRDRRVRTIISNWRIATSYPVTGRPAWTWGRYTGTNGHTSHVHVDVLDTAEAKNDLSPWFPPVDGNSTWDGEDHTMAGKNRVDAQKGVIRHAFRTILLRNPNNQAELDWHVGQLEARGYEAYVEWLIGSPEGQAALTKERKAVGLG